MSSTVTGFVLDGFGLRSGAAAGQRFAMSMDGVSFPGKRSYGDKSAWDYVDLGKDAILVDYRAGTDFRILNRSETDLKIAMRREAEILPDLGIVNTNATNWYAGKDIVVTATVVNYTKRAVPSVTVRLTIGGRCYEEAIPLPGNGTNLAVFRLTLPTTTGATALSFVVDPYNEIPERNDDNNDLDKTIEIVSVPVGVVLDPDLAALETNYKSSGLASLPDTTNSDYHIWQEVRLEGEAYVTKTYWAQLRTVFTVSPDPRIAYEDKPTQMEFGFGIEAYLQTILTTNYDHPEKLVGVQMAWVFSPESGYGQIDGMSGVFDALEPRIWSPDANSMLWEYAVNPWSETNSRLHYTPLWFPDGQYTVLSQAFYAWSPAGQLYWYDAGNVDILGDMYDRVTAIQGR